MRSCRGLSLKTQVLYALIFMTRYLDLFWKWVSVYNTLMKIFFITSSCYIIYLIVVKFRPMDEEESTDTFRVEYLLLPCLIMALLINYHFMVTEIFWSFSIFLEAVAILPQLHMLRRTGQAEALTRYYIIALGSYRALYILNWIYRYGTERLIDPIAILGGVVQTCTNFYFIYIYLKKYPREIDIESPPVQPGPSSGPSVPEQPKPPASTTAHSSHQDEVPSTINPIADEAIIPQE